MSTRLAGNLSFDTNGLERETFNVVGAEERAARSPSGSRRW
jgi:hypothetical protein